MLAVSPTVIPFTRGGRGWSQTAHTGELAIAMAQLPLPGILPPPAPAIDVAAVVEARCRRLAAALERRTDRELEALAAAIRERLDRRRCLCLRDDAAMRAWLERPF